MKLKYLDFDKNNIKYKSNKIQSEVGGTVLNFEAYYNNYSKDIILNVATESDESIIKGFRIRLDVDIFDAITDERLPGDIRLIPLSLTGKSKEISLENFMEDVKIFVIGD